MREHHLGSILFLLAGLLLGKPSISQAQLTLSEGQSFVYQFTTLPYFGEAYGLPPTGLNFATFSSNPGSEDAGDAFRVEIFENSTSETPLAVNTGLGSVTATANGGWHDLQGFARVTVTSGTLTLDNLSVGVYRPVAGSPGEFGAYNSGVVPVPEPATVMLWSVAGLGAIIAFRHRARRPR